MESRNIKYLKKIERRAISVLNECYEYKINPSSVLFGNGYEMVEKILENTKMQDKRHMNRTQDEMNFITSDLPMYYIPNGSAGTVCLKAMFHLEAVEALKEKMREQEKTEVLSLIPLYLPVCKRLQNEKGEITVLCLESQKELADNFIKEAHGQINVRTIADDYLENYFDSLGYPWEPVDRKGIE